MSDDTDRKSVHDPAQTPHSAAPSLTDAEANRQLGQGQAPQPPAGIPEADQAPDQREAGPEAAAGHDDARTAKVGARDVDRPPQQADDKGGGEGNLYDRLAKKDTVPSETGGVQSAVG